MKDFVWWSSLAAAEARAGLEMVKLQLVGESVGGKEYWYDPNQPTEGANPSVAHLLPYLDEYIVAYRDRDDFLNPVFNDLVDSGNVIFHAPFLIDGHVAGHWRRLLKKKRVIIEMTAFRPLSDPERDALAGEADRFGAFVGLPAEMYWVG